jgi:hypothetical protein
LYTGGSVLARIGGRLFARIGGRPLARIGGRPLARIGGRPLARKGGRPLAPSKSVILKLEENKNMGQAGTLHYAPRKTSATCPAGVTCSATLWVLSHIKRGSAPLDSSL